MIKIILSILLLVLTVPVAEAKMVVPPTVTFEWDMDTTGDVRGYRIYYGRTSRYERHLQDDIDVHIRAMCKDQQSCIDTWDNYCDPYDFRVCDADYYAYETSSDIGLVDTVTLIPEGYGTWYYTIVAYYDVDKFAFYSASPPEGPYGAEQTVVVSELIPPPPPKPEPEPEPEPEPPPIVVPPEPEPEPIIEEPVVEEPIIEEPIKPTPIKKKKKRESNGGCFINTLRGD